MRTELVQKGNAITYGQLNVTDLRQLANGEKTFLAGLEYLTGHYTLNVHHTQDEMFRADTRGKAYLKAGIKKRPYPKKQPKDVGSWLNYLDMLPLRILLRARKEALKKSRFLMELNHTEARKKTIDGKESNQAYILRDNVRSKSATSPFTALCDQGKIYRESREAKNDQRTFFDKKKEKT